jgi:hypothetical protein
VKVHVDPERCQGHTLCDEQRLAEPVTARKGAAEIK